MKAIRKCRKERCNIEPIHSGLCEFHKWQRYRENVLAKAEERKKKVDQVLRQKLEKSNKNISISISNIDYFKASRQMKLFNKEQRMELKRRKVEQVFYLYFQGKTMDQIAKTYQITRERIRQLLICHPQWSQIEHRNGVLSHRRPYIYCGQCGKSVQKLSHKQKFCNRECRKNWHRDHKVILSPAEIRKLNNERTKNYYHRVLKHKPEFKEKVKIWNRRKLIKEKAQKIQRIQQAREALTKVDPQLLRNLQG
jgi:hypothetical protein